ncbi:hypothetical protein ACX9MO_18195 [Pseudooceanicola sp. 502str34]
MNKTNKTCDVKVAASEQTVASSHPIWKGQLRRSLIRSPWKFILLSSPMPAFPSSISEGHPANCCATTEQPPVSAPVKGDDTLNGYELGDNECKSFVRDVCRQSG